jgi:predicted PurR-regulated permease PerM
MTAPPPRRRRRTRLERRVTFALKILALVALAIYLIVGMLQFLAAVRAAALLLVGAILFAYLVTPLVRRLNRTVPLLWSIVIVYLVTAGLFVFVIGLLAPALSADLQSLVKTFPSLVTTAQRELSNPTNPLMKHIPLDVRSYLASLPSQLGTLVQQYGFDSLQRAIAVVMSAVSVIGALVVVPVLAAYLLIDAANIRRHLLGLLPVKFHARANALVDDLDAAVGGFIRGQLIDGAILAAMLLVVLTVTHVPYALLIAVVSGLLNFIPYAGAVIAAVPSILLAATTNGPTNAAIVALLIAVVHQIDGNFVAPRVLKENVGLSPVYIIVAILTFTELFGIVGTFLAVPAAAMLRVLRLHLLPPPTIAQEEPVPATQRTADGT